MLDSKSLKKRIAVYQGDGEMSVSQWSMLAVRLKSLTKHATRKRSLLEKRKKKKKKNGIIFKRIESLWSLSHDRSLSSYPLSVFLSVFCLFSSSVFLFAPFADRTTTVRDFDDQDFGKKKKKIDRGKYREIEKKKRKKQRSKLMRW